MLTKSDRNAMAAMEVEATKGPWEIGNRYVTACVNDGSHRGWAAPEWIPPGKCGACEEYGAPVAEETDERGGRLHIHLGKHDPDRKEDWHRISSAASHSAIAGNYDEEEGGVSSTPEDATFIINARSFIPAALADLDEKDALLAHVLEDAEWAAATVHERETYSACPACMLPVHIGHAPACIFAEIARHLAGVRGGTGDGRNDL